MRQTYESKRLYARADVTFTFLKGLDALAVEEAVKVALTSISVTWVGGPEKLCL